MLKKKGLIDDALILFLDITYTTFKELVVKHHLGWLIGSFLKLEIGKGSVIDGLNDEMARVGKNDRVEITEIARFVSKHVI